MPLSKKRKRGRGPTPPRPPGTLVKPPSHHPLDPARGSWHAGFLLDCTECIAYADANGLTLTRPGGDR